MKAISAIVALVLAQASCFVSGAPAADSHQTPAVSIIIDDLGNRLGAGMRTVNLPGFVTCSFLPRTPHVRRLAVLAHDAGKEVMLHLPMQALETPLLDDGGLVATMTRREFVRTVQDDLLDVPYVSGVNNHMGSLLTQFRGHMQWLMEELRRYDGLYFVDSFTTDLSIARQVADASSVPTVRRDVFLDANPEPEFIAQEFTRLVEHARKHGTAVAIGHPYPQTLAFLEANLGTLAADGIELMPVSRLIRYRRLLDAEPRGTVLAAKTWTPAAIPGYPRGGANNTN